MPDIPVTTGLWGAFPKDQDDGFDPIYFGGYWWPRSVCDYTKEYGWRPKQFSGDEPLEPEDYNHAGYD